MKYILLSLIGVFICSQEIAIPYQEKVYLHTDKPFYLVGDTIWLKGYLVNAQTHKESDVQSRFLYIELINRKNKVIQRKKIKEENGHFFNFISLEKDMPIPLRYSLRTSNMIRKKPMGNILLLPCCVKMELPMQILVLST